ncbi:hypothetical protein LT85_p035 (plasmid) [Collimonas arenae]|nr:hypothetical protein LT85_p035 [Collimonas arenae]
MHFYPARSPADYPTKNPLVTLEAATGSLRIPQPGETGN